MDRQEKKMTRIALAVVGVIVGAAIIGWLVYKIVQQEREITSMSEVFSLEKESLLDEYAELSLQYEGEQFSIGNDSLVALLTTEKMKVQRLMEELRTVKTTNAKRISELKKELATLRKIMTHYVTQIDSLNNENQQLKKENRQVVQRYNQARSTAAQLTKEKEKLTERVTLASRLEATAIQVRAVNSRGKEAKKIDKIAQLVLSLHVAKNITAPVGEKALYVRIMRPDDSILQKQNARTFTFEGREITYSMMKNIEYEGEELSVTMYWDVEEYLSPGQYRADIFADGNLIGRKTFSLGK
jgi:predicted RNase H-like nuclease (RuvC/YqgF family)